jgi:hypothetical protein
MTNATRCRLLSGLIGGLLLSAVGCVERTVRIDTRPQGALVILNDEEVGASPVKVSFLWYGDYDLVLRKEGYETRSTSFQLDAPWWQYPPVDFLAEAMWPGMITDDHVLPPFELREQRTPSTEEMVDRATQLREATLP